MGGVEGVEGVSVRGGVAVHWVGTGGGGGR